MIVDTPRSCLLQSSSSSSMKMMMIENLIDWWFYLSEKRWSARGVWGTNFTSLLSAIHSSSGQSTIQSFAQTCYPCERVKNCSFYSIHCFCKDCHTSIMISSEIVCENGIICPYCNGQIDGNIMIINGVSNTCKTIPLLSFLQTLSQLEKTKKVKEVGTEALFVNCFALASLFIPCNVFSRLQVSRTAMDFIPMPLLRCFHQLIYIQQQQQQQQEDEYEYEYEKSYSYVKDLVAECILKVRGVNTIQSTMNNDMLRNQVQQQLIEDVAIALLSCSPSSDLT